MDCAATAGSGVTPVADSAAGRVASDVPTTAVVAVLKIGVGVETAVYLGDDPASDVVGGQAAGLRTIYFPSSQRFHLPAGAEPDAEIGSLTELLPLLASW